MKSMAIIVVNYPGITSKYSVKMIICCLIVILIRVPGIAQNVGVGTNSPQKKFTVNGSLMIDQTNKNYGTLDSAALLFGNNGDVGISSKKVGASALHGLNIWTGGEINLSISSGGNVGIGGGFASASRLIVHDGDSHFEGDINSDGAISALTHAAVGGAVDNTYRLRVYDGNSRFGGDIHATGNAAIGGDVDNAYRLRVIGGNSRFGGDIHATGNAAIGGDVDNTYRLRVYGGNSRFGGDVQVTGNINTSSIAVDNTLTINGTGSVRSNGPSPLRIGFDQKFVNIFIAANSVVDVTADITDFVGDNDDARVFVSQWENDPTGFLNWNKIGISITGLDNGTCRIWLHNHTGSNGVLKGTIYLTTIAKN